MRSINSSVRLHSTNAFDLSVRSGAFSTRRTETPYRARSAAIAKPTGPAPTIRTFVFIEIFLFPAELSGKRPCEVTVSGSAAWAKPSRIQRMTEFEEAHEHLEHAAHGHKSAAHT